MIKALVLNLALSCSPGVSPDMVFDIVSTESGFNEFAVNVNGDFQYDKPDSLLSALDLASRALAQGFSVDLGLMQVNSNNLSRYGVSITEVFDPCTNLSIGSSILYENYQRAVRRYGKSGQALLAALSAYNTGSFTAGFHNGYVRQYLPSVSTLPDPTLLAPSSTEARTLYRQALAASSVVNPIAEVFVMPKESLSPPTKEMLQELSPDLNRILDEATVRPTAVRQDVADVLGAFDESAVSAEDVEAARLLDEDDE